MAIQSRYSHSTEEYLKALSQLGARDRPVTIGELADHLGVTTVSVHQMVRRLTEQHLLEYQPYVGISLSPTGLKVASGVLRRHRLWERFLHDVLDLPRAQVHQEAGRLEHVTTPMIADRLSVFLNDPDRCPHGYPITPSNEAAHPELSYRALTDLDQGESSIIVRLPEQHELWLSQADAIGMRPATRLKLLSIAPKKDRVTVLIGEQKHQISYSLAKRIIVEAV